MVTVIEAVNSLTNTLNNVDSDNNPLSSLLIDPLSDRNGNQFFSYIEGLNLDRRDTFPKGFIKKLNEQKIRDSAIGKTVHQMHIVTFGVFYYVVVGKHGNKYVSDSITYKEEGFVEFMLDKIWRHLEANQEHFLDLHHLEFGDVSEIKRIKSPKGNFTIAVGNVPVTVRWHGC